MDKREISMRKLQDIVTELLNDTAIKTIARHNKVSKNTIKKYRSMLNTILENQPDIRNDLESVMEQFKLLRKQNAFSENFGWLEKHEELINKLSLESNNYIILYPKLQQQGYMGSYSSLLRYINKYREKQEAPIFRIETKPGDYAQVDFGYLGYIHDPKTGNKVKAWVFVLVLCYSRHAYYEIVKNQDVRTWCRCHINSFEFFGGVPKVIIPDNLKSGILKASFTHPLINRSYGDLADLYGFKVDPCLPATPQHKGKVESGVKYVKNNFRPFRAFTDFQDANQQLREWNRSVASIRTHGTTRKQPIELFEKYEKSILKPVVVERFEIPVYKKCKVYRDIHIQFNKAYYSAPHELRGKYLTVRGTESQIALFDHEIELVAVHPVVGMGKFQTNMKHYPPDENNYLKNDTQYCLQKAASIGESTHQVVTELLQGGPIRNLRGAQNIVRLVAKYPRERVEKACQRAVFFGNYEYRGIKTILEKEIDKKAILFPEKREEKQLSTFYAINIQDFLEEVSHLGNICPN